MQIHAPVNRGGTENKEAIHEFFTNSGKEGGYKLEKWKEIKS